MNIHEHQAKQLLARYGVAVPKGKVAYTPAEAENAFNELGVSVCAVKGQIHAGGRGKGKVYDPREGLYGHQARRIAFFLGLTGDAFKSGVQFLIAMAKAFGELDCSLAEINPLVVTQEGQVVALDAKINFDDNALYRHKDVEE